MGDLQVLNHILLTTWTCSRVSMVVEAGIKNNEKINVVIP